MSKLVDIFHCVCWPSAGIVCFFPIMMVYFLLCSSIPYYVCFGVFPTKDMQTPPPNFSSHFNRRCAMCWIEWKFNFPIFLFWAMDYFVHNFGHKMVIKLYSNFFRFRFKGFRALWMSTGRPIIRLLIGASFASVTRKKQAT